MNVSVIALWLMHRLFKGTVRPYYLTVFVQKCGRNFKIPQEPFLDLPVLRGKADQLIHQDRFIEIHHDQRHDQIKKHKTG